MKKLLSFLLILLVLALNSCDQVNFRQEESAPSSEELLQADRDFSRMSKERGMKAAFTQFMSKEGVLLRPDENPIVGADAIEYISQINDNDYKVAWNPLKADISSDGKMGYTYGIYEIAVQDTVIKGTYVNVWKKQNGNWRFVINSGNQGTASE